jgi:hypothetical protein
MTDYILVYQGGVEPATKEEGAAHMAKWQAWAQGLGDAIVNPGTPTGSPKIVSADGVSDDTGPSAMSGYTIVQTDSMDGALKMAKECPFIEMEGATLAVAELKKM